MGRQARSLHSENMVASGAVSAHRFVLGTGVQAVDGESALGVSESAAADAEVFPLTVIGTAIIECGNTFAKGAAVQSDVNGMAIVKAAGTKNGIAMEACTVAGQFVEILVVAN